jgi:transcriptional regulator with XRE-family HTH domain
MNQTAPSQTFQDWLGREVAWRGWTFQELGRQAKLSSAAISRVMTGVRLPTWDFCLAISRALDTPPVSVFRRAGLLPWVPESRWARIEEIADFLRDLPPGIICDEALESILAIARYASQRGQAEKESGASQAAESLDRSAILAHFARRKQVARYRPTAHDEKKLDLLEQGGYSQAEIVAAIDRAFDSRAPDAPPIRMFSYCAAVALSTPARETNHGQVL